MNLSFTAPQFQQCQGKVNQTNKSVLPQWRKGKAPKFPRSMFQNHGALLWQFQVHCHFLILIKDLILHHSYFIYIIIHFGKSLLLFNTAYCLHQADGRE